MATQGVKTHASLGEVAPLATDAVALWRGAVGAEQVGYAEVGDLIAPTITERSLADGGGTPLAGILTGTAAFAGLTNVFVLTGAATGPFSLTVPDGVVENQQIKFVVIGNHNNHTVELVSEAASSFSAVRRNEVFTVWWRGSSWSRQELSTSITAVISGSGSPVGSVAPTRLDQVYRDTTNGDLYHAYGFTNTSWTLISGGGGGDTAPTVVEFSASAALTAAQRSANNVQVYAGANSIDFDVPVSVVGSWIIRAYDKDDDTPRSGCTVSVVGNAGEVNDSAGGSREIAPGGTAIVTSTGGSTPSVKVTGNIFEPDLSRGATTFASGDTLVLAADHQRSITITGNQVIQVAVANVKAGFTAVYWASGGDRTIDGLDADHIIPSGGAATVHKTAAGALVCVGAKTTSPGVTVLDAS